MNSRTVAWLVLLSFSLVVWASVILTTSAALGMDVERVCWGLTITHNGEEEVTNRYAEYRECALARTLLMFLTCEDKAFRGQQEQCREIAQRLSRCRPVVCGREV